MSDSPFDELDDSGIDAFVVDRADGVRIHGYDLIGDLAQHYEPIEVMYLTLVGRFATREEIAAIRVAMACAADVGIADAAAHGARLARHLAEPAGNEASVPSVAALAVAELVRFDLESCAALLDWLSSTRSSAPPVPSGAPHPVSRTLASLAPQDWGLDTVLERGATPLQAIVAILWSCGLRERHQLAAVLVCARLPVVIAEAFAPPDARLWAYPLNLPFWDYTDG